MNISTEKLVCTDISSYSDSNRTTPFLVVKYQFYYQSELFDKSILTKITEAGELLAASVTDKAASNSIIRRNSKRIKSNAIAGLLAEYCWKSFLNHASPNLLVQETPYTDATSQIDLETIVLKKSIEVRSSFPRNGVAFAICSKRHQFDILGPYKNEYKSHEIQKDFYLRTLFHVPNPISFLEEYKKDGFVVYLTGGATWDMMADDNIAIDKTLTPEDEVSKIAVESTYRVVPFSKALDCGEIYQRMKELNADGITRSGR